MQRLLRRHLKSGLLGFLAMMAAAILPFGSVAGAASNFSTNCPDFEGFYCDLMISAPGSVATGQPFAVKVTLMYGDGEGLTPLPGNDPCAAGVRVQLVVSYYDGEENHVEVNYFANASKGIATFNVAGLPPGAGSTMKLDASATQASGKCQYGTDWVNEITVLSVDPDQPIYPCPPGESCTQTTSGFGTAATLFAETGWFTASFQPLGSGDGCFNTSGPAGDDPNGVLAFDYTPDSPPASEKSIVFGLSPELVTKGIGQYNVCWKKGDDPWYYLPNCSKTEGPPCVDFRTSTQFNGAFIGIKVPAGDPLVYVE